MNIKHSIICLYMHCFRCKDFRFRQMVKITNGSDEKGVFTFPPPPPSWASPLDLPLYTLGVMQWLFP